MDRITHRLLFISLALIPASAMLMIVWRGGFQLPAMLLTVACSLMALGGSMTEPRRPSAPVSRGYAALRRVPRDLPDTASQHAAIARALVPEDRQVTMHTPLSREQATAWVLRRALMGWGLTDLDRMTEEQRATLFLLARLMTTAPGEAGRLAQYFRRPDAVLGLRDEIDTLARARATWDRDHRLFLATQWLWTRQRHHHEPGSLLEALQALGPSDIDLWHRVVLEHDGNQPAQRDAALWCLRQAGCDRATVATYLAQVALDGRLLGAAHSGNAAYLAAVRATVANWNAGHYRTAELALDPPDALVGAELRVAQTFHRLSHLTGQAWPMPIGAFGRHDGRPPRLRQSWDLASGHLTRDPERGDYLDAPVTLPLQPHIA
ncbi:hypothetical protein [Sagittula salina]|uniref:Uncharacterized protein n=1 Tax=Sagittula salina TaxID=2820268 RepID=A0A940MMR9_9RHOB|nr:hypothetical protein [Sagittula salina]MBP0482383.1 hypothetical protein [Sagittula salina]